VEDLDNRIQTEEQEVWNKITIINKNLTTSKGNLKIEECKIVLTFNSSLVKKIKTYLKTFSNKHRVFPRKNIKEAFRN
jgi:hypothetical protein